MDPRVKTLPDDLSRQFELNQKIAGALHNDYQALQQVRSLRAQLKQNSAGAKTARLTAATKASAEAETKAAAIEGEAGSYGSRYLSTPEGRSLSRLNSGFNALLSALNSADAAPTTQQVATFVELEKALQEQLSAWAELKSKDIPELNRQRKKAGLPAIDLQKPVAGPGDAAETTSQDRDRNEE
jgi:hypothetical protein